MPMNDSIEKDCGVQPMKECGNQCSYEAMRIDSLRNLCRQIDSMLSILEMYESKLIAKVLIEYRYSVDHLLQCVLNSEKQDQFDKAEAHIRHAYKIAAENVIRETYDHFERNYSRLLRFSRKTGVGRMALHSIRASMDKADIKNRLSDLHRVDDFLEYLCKAGSVQTDFIDLSKQLSDAITECET